MAKDKKEKDFTWIVIKKPTWKQLKYLKVQLDLKSFNDVIDYLIKYMK